jgi:hypothetical protein
MPKIAIAYNPQLTIDKIKALFVKKFTAPYEIIDNAGLLGVDFAVKKTNWTGVSVRYLVKPEKGEASIRFYAFAPSVMVRMFLNGLIPMIILSLTTWRQIEAEVKDFIMNCADIQILPK